MGGEVTVTGAGAGFVALDGAPPFVAVEVAGFGGTTDDLRLGGAADVGARELAIVGLEAADALLDFFRSGAAAGFVVAAGTDDRGVALSEPAPNVPELIIYCKRSTTTIHGDVTTPDLLDKGSGRCTRSLALGRLDGQFGLGLGG